LKKSLEILKKYWGYDAFRPNQEEIVDDAINGHDVLALLPTGGGKSICFQVPGLAREGITIVISPLIALMHDQVNNLKKNGIRAIALTGGMSYREMDITLDNARFGGYDFLYTSPERLKSELFIERFKTMPVNLLVVDEAHCISEWGHDFRPSFLEIAAIRQYHPEVPLLALTATATKRVQEDIIHHLQLRNPKIHEASFKRDNLIYNVYKSVNKLENIISFCQENQGVGIVYCQTRRSVKDVARILLSKGIPCGYYHGGLNMEERNLMLQRWMREEARIMVATNAFGMGIDKPNVRFVLHYELPMSPEAYFQEAGRGGRDGRNSVAICYYEPHDGIELLEKVAMQFPEKDKIIHVYRALCNFLRLAIGSGQNEVFSIDIKVFIKQYNLEYIEAYNSLKILELNGYIVLSEGILNPTKVKFLVNNRELYNFQVSQERFYPLTALLLRTYPGIFDYYQTIHDFELCNRLKIPMDSLKSQLEKMQELGVIDFSWRSEDPTITFLQPRWNDNELRLKPEIYRLRKENAENKARKMLSFCEDEICRAQQIIEYFGQKSEPCGKCDACLRNMFSEFNFNNLLKVLETKRRYSELLQIFPDSEASLKHALRLGLNEEKIKYKDEYYSLL
jgi:ATP-dependent DNA helicase RecQ